MKELVTVSYRIRAVFSVTKLRVTGLTPCVPAKFETRVAIPSAWPVDPPRRALRAS
jgi:hypothetical protein